MSESVWFDLKNSVFDPNLYIISAEQKQCVMFDLFCELFIYGMYRFVTFDWQ